jgi:hypothetical protein
VSLQLEYGFARTSKDIDSDLVVDVSIGIDDPLNQQINWMLDILRSIEACNLGPDLTFTLRAEHLAPFQRVALAVLVAGA